MKQDKIEQELSKDRAVFYNRPFKKKLPKGFSGYFQKAIFSIAPMADNISTTSLKEWLSKKEGELNFGQVSKMCDIIAGVTRDKVFASLEEAISVLGEIELLMKHCTEEINANEQKIARKRSSLLNMTGVSADEHPTKVKKIKTK